MPDATAVRAWAQMPVDPAAPAPTGLAATWVVTYTTSRGEVDVHVGAGPRQAGRATARPGEGRPGVVASGPPRPESSPIWRAWDSPALAEVVAASPAWRQLWRHAEWGDPLTGGPVREVRLEVASGPTPFTWTTPILWSDADRQGSSARWLHQAAGGQVASLTTPSTGLVVGPASHGRLSLGGWMPGSTTQASFDLTGETRLALVVDPAGWQGLPAPADAGVLHLLAPDGSSRQLAWDAGVAGDRVGVHVLELDGPSPGTWTVAYTQGFRPSHVDVAWCAGAIGREEAAASAACAALAAPWVDA